MRSLVLCLLLLARAGTLPAQYQDETVRLAVPAGFEGPEVLTPSPGMKIVGYVREIPGTGRGTLLQVSTIEVGAAELSQQGSGNVQATESLLDEFLLSVERRRETFEVATRGRVDLSGLSAARAEWRGLSRGRGMHGVAYCVIVGSRVVILHAQTFNDAPEDHFPAAVQAIESVILQPS